MFDYKNLTRVCYPQGAGGKFLINCLALNNEAVLQDRKLAQQQLDGKFTVADKLNYIFNRLQITKENRQWDDLQLGCGNLFEVGSNRYLDTFPEILKNRLTTITTRNCIDNNLHLFLISHDFVLMEHQARIWTGSKLIVFTNYRNFVSQRSNYHLNFDYNSLQQYWNRVRATDWPTDPPTTQKLVDKLPLYIQSTLVDELKNEIVRYLLVDFNSIWRLHTEELKKSTNLFEFNVDYAYSNSKNFYKNYLEVCQYVDLPAAEFTIIEKYFNEWQAVINVIKSSSALPYNNRKSTSTT